MNLIILTFYGFLGFFFIKQTFGCKLFNGVSKAACLL